MPAADGAKEKKSREGRERKVARHPMERLAYVVFLWIVGLYCVYYIERTNALYARQMRLLEHARKNIAGASEDAGEFSYVVYDTVDKKIVRKNVDDDVAEHVLDAVPPSAAKLLVKQIADVEMPSHSLAIAHVEEDRLRSISFMGAA